MQVNPNLFVIPRTPCQIVWNYKNHKQFELNLKYSLRLAEPIDALEKFDHSNSIDSDFLTPEFLQDQKTLTLNGVGTLYQKYFMLALKSSLPPIPLKMFIRVVGLDKLTIAQILCDMTDANSYLLRARSGAGSTLQALKMAGVFDLPAHRKLFSKAGLLDE
ncbi:hypothetical protein [Pseudomonas sp. NPDC089569]|uniref:hypothetical protein n=1 Tax=Pseudomonas sp. NPDC089569 TaxID=3390722 RepID=UPI003D0910D8